MEKPETLSTSLSPEIYVGVSNAWVLANVAEKLDCGEMKTKIRKELEKIKRLGDFMRTEIMPHSDKIIYVGKDEDDYGNIAVYTITHPIAGNSDKKKSEDVMFPVIYMTCDGISRICLNPSDIPISKLRKAFKLGPKPASFVKAIPCEKLEFKNVIKIKPKSKKMVSCFNDMAETIDQEYDRITRRKLGVMLQLPGQTDECVMFQNKTTDEFEHFLNIFSSCVELKGYTGYSGGLDTSERCGTGTTTRIMESEGVNVLFHVSTLLPYTNEEQQLKKKRHIANDNVVIIFQDNSSLSSEEFKDKHCYLPPGPIRSQVIQMYIVVTLLPFKKENVSNQKDTVDKSEENDSSSTSSERKPNNTRKYLVNVVHHKSIKNVEPELTKEITSEGIGEKQLKEVLEVLVPGAASSVWEAPILAAKLSGLYRTKLGQVLEMCE